ncbi:hypothetical protein PFICI_15035 [Pestalotiopsis fici W106-1]|uniref:Uncharacterized protein n=1 Tax=Pestalotiopsis fici (strain W106-1 / CGMCC3.15140) TaxID=1229662 RepID=W3WHM0_PESFW|nr:uncharacterized protein PFICI_15035 [Pestalotiopsis fici W106-1]ETS73430.1 hypothetical protein PFICI_15035 [Pestalotiopsis fici W106-1]
MARFQLFSLIFFLVGLCSSTPTPRRVARQVASETTDNPTICGDIIDLVNEGNLFFYASDAFACLTSVPFNQAVAVRFIDYYNTTIQFQSTLSYLKNPPVGYQQPAVDFEGELQKIKANATAGVYKNQYAFEADLLKLVYSTHDAHVSLSAGIMSSFSFASIYDLVTASKDGSSTPEIYIFDDVYERQQTGIEISPVTQLNGVDVVEFLTRFGALNSVGLLEPHADWNQLMYNPVQTVLNQYTSFSGGATFYEGPLLNFTFANGSTLSTPWVAIYTNTDFTGPLTTGGDYFNYFVLGLVPPSIDEVPLPPMWNSTGDSDDTSIVATRSFEHGWDNITGGEYPAADVIQDDLEGSGWFTAYFLDDISTAVLSIPSFDEAGFAVTNFSAAVEKALQQAQEQNLTRLVIDLQGNQGGTPLLAFSTFRTIFPGIEPFAGSRRRSHELADALGQVKTSYWADILAGADDPDDMLEYMAADEWVVIDRLNAATGKNFSSWAEYYGPLSENGDLFSLVEQYDLANMNFDNAAFDGFYSPLYIPGGEPDGPGYWKAEDVVILTDGLCSSTCSLFVEMMTHQAKARTIVVGGRPQTGPMQSVGGSRGARAYDTFLLDEDFTDAITFDDAAATSLPNRTDTGMYITEAGFNLRDQVRSATDPIGPPLQFDYLAADCRLYFTLDNVLNMTALWRDVATAAWQDTSRCVKDSTGYTTTSADGSAMIPKPPPQTTAVTADIPAIGYLFDADPTPDDSSDDAIPMVDGQVRAKRSAPVVPCDPEDPKECVTGVSTCQPIQVSCANGKTSATTHACVKVCNVGQSNCGSDAPVCNQKIFHESKETKSLLSPKKDGITGKQVARGFCVPRQGNTKLGCSAK